MKAVSVAMPGAPDGWKKKFTAFATKNGVDMKDRNDRRVFGYYMSALGLNVIDNEAIEIRIPSTIDVVGGGGSSTNDHVWRKCEHGRKEQARRVGGMVDRTH